MAPAAPEPATNRSGRYARPAREAPGSRIAPAAGRAAALATPALVAAAVGALLVYRPSAALVLAFVPITLALVGRRVLASRLLALFLGGLALAGRDFSYFHAGPLFITEIMLAVFIVCCSGEIVRAIGLQPFAAALVAMLCLVTAFSVYQSGVSVGVLRNAVLGYYSIWLLVGMAFALIGGAAFKAVPRILYWASVPVALLLILSAKAPGNALSTTLSPRNVPVAQSLYIGMAVLLFLLAPQLVPARRTTAKLVFLLQLTALAIGQVRSLWFALPVVLLASLFMNRGVPRVHARIIVLPLLAASLLLVVGEIAKPGIVGSTATEAASITGFSQGHSYSDRNAEWRLTAWTYARHQVGAHPLSGIGLAGEELPLSLCSTACSAGGTGAAIHNSVLAMAERLGLPALALLILIAGAICRAAWLGRADPITRWLAASSLLVLLTSFTAVVLEGPYMGVFFWIFGGMAIMRAKQVAPPPRRVRAPSRLPATRAVMPAPTGDFRPGRVGPSM